MTNDRIHINGNRNSFMVTMQVDAPGSKVFEAWTNADIIKHWWGPHHFTNPVCQVESRVGGKINIAMTAPDGAVFPMSGIFHEIRLNSKLVFSITAFEDTNGNSPLEYINTVTFNNDNGEFTSVVLESEVMRAMPGIECLIDGIKEGWNQSFNKLETLLLNIEKYKI